MADGLPHVEAGCRCGFLSEFEYMQLAIIEGTIHMTLDGTDNVNKKEGYVKISKVIISKQFDESGNLVDIEPGASIKGHTVLRHRFAFHCTTSYLGTEEEQAADVIPELWMPPYEKDHADGDAAHQSRRNVRICHRNDNLRARNLLENNNSRTM
jgi:hypothetical protein